MKKIFKYIPILAAVLLAVSCSNLNEDILFKAEDANVGFVSTSFDLTEGPDATIQVPITLAGVPGGAAVTVTIDVSADGGAEEGKDYEITSGKSITFDEGYGEKMITIKCIDDEVFTGNRSFTINIADNAGLKANTSNACVVKIIDNEHPLKPMLGEYSVTVSSAFTGADETFVVTVTPDGEDVTKLWVANWGNPYYGIFCEPVFMLVDTDNMTVRIPTPQSVGNPGYGASSMFVWDTDPAVDDKVEGDLVGTIGDDWSIDMSDQAIAIHIDEGDNAGYWTAAQYNIVWTKQ